MSIDVGAKRYEVGYKGGKVGEGMGSGGDGECKWLLALLWVCSRRV